jgi:hypothetical protein
MSLLDTGPETITVYPAGPAGEDGSPTEGEPVIVRGCRIQPQTSSADDSDGYQDATTYRVLRRSLPAGPWARVRWNDRDYTVVGEPSHYRGSKRVAHDAAVIRRR